MKWPEKPTCHDVAPVFKIAIPSWRTPEPTRPPYGSTFRTCSYCGSIHPEDLAKYLSDGATLGGSDWKYGWPHKFYVQNIPNPLAGQTVETGSRWENGVSTPITGAAPEFSFAKWYNDHLGDEGYDDEAREKLFDLLKIHSGIEFKLQDGKIGYKAPYHGFQR
jgi:hypothetical protein